MINRRELMGFGAASVVSCARSRAAYFGNTAPPSSQRLVFGLPGDPETLDPAKSNGFWEFYIIPLLFEGLTQFHPELTEPVAALATHYTNLPDMTRYTFYLRGHPSPQGSELPSTKDLTALFGRGQKPAAPTMPACWSDGTPITAHDFVYSWRRFVDPTTAAPFAYQMFYLKNAEDVFAGRRSPRDLGVRALDDFTLEVELRSPTPFLLQLVTEYLFPAVPRQAIQKFGAAWTEPQHIVTSGPFTLREWRPREKLITTRSPTYYDANVVALNEAIFYPISDQTTAVNLYKTGEVVATTGLSLPPVFMPALAGKKDFRTTPALGTGIAAMNTRRPPFNNTLLRYAVNMATDKKALATLLGGGRVPARNIVFQFKDYLPPGSVPVSIDGVTFDVSAFDPQGARSMLARARSASPLEFTYHCDTSSQSRALAEALQQQWRNMLDAKVSLSVHVQSVLWNMVQETDYTGIADFLMVTGYADPAPFLDPFVAPASGNPSGWTDPQFISALSDANGIADREARMSALSQCEKMLLTGMPVVPVYHDTWRYLAKPFVRGLSCNALDLRSFKYAWIDTKWKPS
jgi:oligopeptide transport system substrate-binding protein